MVSVAMELPVLSLHQQPHYYSCTHQQQVLAPYAVQVECAVELYDTRRAGSGAVRRGLEEVDLQGGGVGVDVADQVCSKNAGGTRGEGALAFNCRNAPCLAEGVPRARVQGPFGTGSRYPLSVPCCSTGPPGSDTSGMTCTPQC